MRIVSNFAVLKLLTTRRLLRLSKVFEKTLYSKNENLDIVTAFVVIEIQNTYSNFSRNYFLSCTRNPKLISGTKVSCDPSISNYKSALDIAMKSLRPKIFKKGNYSRFDEPHWHVPATLHTSCREIKCSHITQIANAFSLPVKVFDDLPKFRNFYAHRNDDTITKPRQIASNWGIPSLQHPTQILSYVPLGRPQPLLIDYIDEMLNVIDLLCS